MNKNTNEWIGEGNIVTDVMLRHTKDSVRPVVNMIMFIDSSYNSKKNSQDSDYVVKKRVAKIPIVAWHKKAEYICSNFQKGDKVRVKGSIRTRTFQKDGQTFNTFEIVIAEMMLLYRHSEP